MFLFVFDYLGEPHCAACNESSIGDNQNFYEDLARIVIGHYFKAHRISIGKSCVLNIVKIYEVVKVSTSNEDFDGCLKYTIKNLDIVRDGI